MRRSLKDDKRLIAERRGESELRFAKWEVRTPGRYTMNTGGDQAGRRARGGTQGRELTAATERQAGRGQGPQQGQRGRLQPGYSERPVER